MMTLYKDMAHLRGMSGHKRNTRKDEDTLKNAKKQQLLLQADAQRQSNEAYPMDDLVSASTSTRVTR